MEEKGFKGMKKKKVRGNRDNGKKKKEKKREKVREYANLQVGTDPFFSGALPILISSKILSNQKIICICQQLECDQHNVCNYILLRRTGKERQQKVKREKGKGKRKTK